jgi:aspartate aminotransferase
MKPLSKKIQNITASVTLAISAKAKQMKKKGIDVVVFGAGEPDFDTPSPIKQAAIKAIEAGATKYTPASGTEELKKAVAEKFKRDNGLDYGLDEVVISCGAKHSLYNLFQTICEAGDEVIICSPYWVSYPEMIKLADARPTIVETKEEDSFLPSASSLASAVSPKTKAILINSPCNPTGAVYPEKLLQEIGSIAVKNDLWIISDEVYEKIIFDSRKHISVASLGQDIKKRTVLVNAVSKTYAMTGWRIGYIAGPSDIVKGISKLQSHSTSNPNSIAQKAALEALKGDQAEVLKMAKEFEARRDFLTERLAGFKGVSCAKPAGEFYLFLNIGSFLGQNIKGREIKDSLDFANYLLDEANVAVVPGAAFGADDYIRISFATSLEELAKGMDRIEEATGKIGVKASS